MIRNLGHVLSILARHEMRDMLMQDDLRAYHAPSECYDDVARGDKQRWRETRKLAEATAQRPYRVICQEATRRGMPINSPKWQSFVGRLCNSYYAGRWE